MRSPAFLFAFSLFLHSSVNAVVLHGRFPQNVTTSSHTKGLSDSTSTSSLLHSRTSLRLSKSSSVISTPAAKHTNVESSSTKARSTTSRPHSSKASGKTGSSTSVPKSIHSTASQAKNNQGNKQLAANGGGFEQQKSSDSSSSSSSSSTYTFNPNATDNLAVYYGSTNKTSDSNLTSLCNTTNVDMVILTFIRDIIGGGGYPDVSFSNLGCTGQTASMEASNATGLLWCPDLASEITYCQGIGKKVFVSLGGANGNITFANETMANSSAEMLWDIFGAGTGSNTSYRPFGDAVVDGFDIDNETGDENEWPTFVSALKALFGTHSQKTFYLSAAPQCYYPSPSEPLSMLTQMDFVWPQFYDSATCGVGTSGFNNSIAQWSKRLDTGAKPKLLIGGLSFDDGGAGGYVDAGSFAEVVEEVKTMKLTNFAGVMLWDGPYALLDVSAAGEDVIDLAKEALES